MPQVNPDILKWARETAGLALGEAAAALGIKDARGTSATDRLAALEAGEVEPSRPLLLRMSKQYRRPLLAFYQARRPEKAERGQDFRTLPTDRSVSTDAMLDALVRDIAVRQGMVRAVIEADPESSKLAFIGSMKRTDGAAAVSTAIQQTLHFDLTQFRAANSAESAFTVLREWTEAAGIFVLLIGNLGSHHTSFDVEDFRGFAIADEIAPFIVVNDQDAKSAWSFTLLHELTHLWLGETGVSGYFANSVVEQLCNDVASRILLPTSDLAVFAVDPHWDIATLANHIGGFATSRNISSSLVAYRLYRSNRLVGSIWQELRQFYRQRWSEERVNQRTRNKEKETGPNYYVVRRHRVGPALVNFVRRTLAEGELTTVKAGKVLGVQPKNVQGVITPKIRSTRRAM
jgi:Zn-dependent peptidase ImmA (M78 family)